MRHEYGLKYAAAILLMLCVGAPGLAQAEPDVQVFAYPEILGPRDVLQDGDNGQRIRIDDNTFYMWVDLWPEMRFTHPVAHVLISPRSVRVIDGGWWPVLNGERLFNDGDEHLVRFPLDLRPMLSAMSISATRAETIKVYAGPFPMREGDVLGEGPFPSFRIPFDAEAMLVWVDLHPRMRFVHDTVHIVVTSEPKGVRAVAGQGWPELNERRILYGEHNDWGIFFPFDLGE